MYGLTVSVIKISDSILKFLTVKVERKTTVTQKMHGNPSHRILRILSI